ncbi:hypothetical protein G6F46_009736 [Rhizopus delemar]|uniref:Uncharacterized protein n=2 Tax=Rhizopus TaxID=4842 RepID=A0A9P6YX06_9FUNG|nr:hypothetical protein G6F55_008685 [Rhizopus delemar]KAG1538358.1 hypothetical protein G6F51_009818 [Rhizopus arrhizus]KAG1492796.1 hypothetical protein G6F54_009042 [Rhizopus delemar]KAG1506684.1 hypothetical protein G6F53_009512 [Rhizopus delemar]KAG1521841.1 hypothetical protein G6F52_006382 [Rhizopus delemar]
MTNESIVSTNAKTTEVSGLVDMKKLEREINEIRENSGQRPYTDEVETADPFNRLWSVVEPMMDKLSNSITYPASSFGSINEEEEDELESAELNRIKKELSDALHDSLPSGADDDDRIALEEAKKEYEELQIKLKELKDYIQVLEKKSIDNTALKSSIVQFKNNVHKQAKLLLQNQEHALMTRSAMSAGRTTLGHSTAEMVNRIKELEESNRNLKLQNRKLDAYMEKYRERFEKLKEGAKKRQQDA